MEGPHISCLRSGCSAPRACSRNGACQLKSMMAAPDEPCTASAPTLGDNAMPAHDFALTAAQAVDIWIENSKDPLQFAKAIFRIASVRSIPDAAPAVAQEGTHSVSALDLLADRDAEFRAAVVQPSTDILRSYFETIVKYLEADLPGLALNTAEKARALLANGE